MNLWCMRNRKKENGQKWTTIFCCYSFFSFILSMCLKYLFDLFALLYIYFLQFYWYIFFSSFKFWYVRWGFTITLQLICDCNYCIRSELIVMKQFRYLKLPIVWAVYVAVIFTVHLKLSCLIFLNPFLCLFPPFLMAFLFCL